MVRAIDEFHIIVKFPIHLNPTGAFGVVSLVKERDTGQLFAMKQVFLSVFISYMPNVFIHPFHSTI